MLRLIAPLFFLFSLTLHAEEKLPPVYQSMLGDQPQSKFSFHKPMYVVGGENDLKLQFSFKYRLTQKLPVFFAYTQLMFWDIYKQSKPFRDINYHPEVFYRLIEKDDRSFRTLDIGYIHSSNGKDQMESRSLDRFFLRANYHTSFGRHLLDFTLMAYHITNEDSTNENIRDNIGYWELLVMFSNILIHDEQNLDLELRLFAGEEGYDLDRGGVMAGLIYNFGSKNFNPSLYVQYYRGYAENLLEYDQKSEEYRAGLKLTF